MTPEDHRVKEAWEAGSREGYKLGAKSRSHEIEWLRGECERLRLEVEGVVRSRPFRTQTEDGHQIVSVGRYSYAWDGSEPLAVGDTVRVPANYVSEAQTAVVTSLGGEYEGPLRHVQRWSEAS